MRTVKISRSEIRLELVRARNARNYTDVGTDFSLRVASFYRLVLRDAQKSVDLSTGIIYLERVTVIRRI